MLKFFLKTVLHVLISISVGILVVIAVIVYFGDAGSHVIVIFDDAYGPELVMKFIGASVYTVLFFILSFRRNDW